MTDFLQLLRKTIENHNLIPDGVQVAAGVSGGADSVALLRALHQLGIPCTVAHLNHRLRGDASDGDEQFVRELAEELGLPIVVKSVDVKQLAERFALSIEMAARQARHRFFAEFGEAVIALAHHADDQVETFLLKLARGAGSGGLGGMPPVQEIGPLRLIRPMLSIRRAAIVQWLQENGFAWREDASNADEAILRNKVRHAILPMLEQELNPNIRETILRTMDILRAENAFLEEASGAVEVRGAKLEASPTLQQPPALRRRIVRRWLFEQGAEEAGFDAVEKILSLMESGQSTTAFGLNSRQRVVVEYGTPRFETDGPRPADGE